MVLTSPGRRRRGTRSRVSWEDFLGQFSQRVIALKRVTDVFADQERQPILLSRGKQERDQEQPLDFGKFIVGHFHDGLALRRAISVRAQANCIQYRPDGFVDLSIAES